MVASGFINSWVLELKALWLQDLECVAVYAVSLGAVELRDATLGPY